MSYRIDYQGSKKVRGLEKRTAPLPALLGCGLLLGLLAVSALWPRGAEVLREILIPGKAEVTAAAMDQLAGELRSGEGLEDALENFCRQVISYGQP